ncbi:MAG: hypothetical protein GF320_15145 [Armatimonadia bacterium]|nr:hypothetical protein [Armatimonadia bacterium]
MIRSAALKVALLAAALTAVARAQPIQVSETDARYFQWRGNDRVQLIGYDYYSLFNTDQIDPKLDWTDDSGKPYYEQFIDMLVDNDLNFTRCFITSGWDNDRFPWARVDTPDAPLKVTSEHPGGERYPLVNLEEWDPVFWSRARAILDYASERGVVVQVCLIDECGLESGPGERRWPFHPFNPANNLPGTMGAWMLPAGLESGVPAAYDLGNQALRDMYVAYFKKWVAETEGLDNIIFEIGNEHTSGLRFHRWAVEMLRDVAQCPFLISANAFVDADRIYAMGGIEVIADHGPKTPFSTKALARDWRRFDKPMIVDTDGWFTSEEEYALTLASLQTALDQGAHVNHKARDRVRRGPEERIFVQHMRDLQRRSGGGAKWAWPKEVLDGERVEVVYDRRPMEYGVYLRRADVDDGWATIADERGKWCVYNQIENPSEHAGRYLYFAVDPGAFGRGPMTLDLELEAFLDAEEEGSVIIEYATEAGDFAGRETIALPKTRWETVTARLDDAVLGARQHNVADFRIDCGAPPATVLVHRIMATAEEGPVNGGSASEVEAITEFATSPKGERFAINGKGTFLRGVREGYVGGDWNPTYWNSFEPEVDYESYATQLRRWGLNWVRANGISMAEGSGRVHGANELPGEEPLENPPEPPYTRRPWVRSGGGIAWDGLPKYDLSDFDPWYFQRLDELVGTMNRHGIVVEFIFFHQHCLYEQFTHWADSPWRPENNVNDLGLPSGPVCYPEFYDLTNDALVAAQTAYVDRVLEALGKHPGVIYRIVDEYNGPANWVTYWVRYIQEHPSAPDDPVFQIGATLEVTRVLAGLGDVDSFDTTFFGVLPTGEICTPPSYQNVRLAGHCPPEFSQGEAIGATLDHLFDRWIKAYVGEGDPTVDGFLRAMTGGGAGWFYHGADPESFDASGSRIAAAIAERAGDMSGWFPSPRVLQEGDALCVGLPGRGYLLYVLSGDRLTVSLPAMAGGYSLEWLETAKGKWSMGSGVDGGRTLELELPGPDSTVLLIRPGALR